MEAIDLRERDYEVLATMLGAKVEKRTRKSVPIEDALNKGNLPVEVA